MPQPVRISDIVDGMQIQSEEMQSYLHLPTGRMLTISDEAFAAAEDDDDEWVTPEELADARAILANENEYLALPDRFEIDEYHMMEAFARSLADDQDREAALISLRGRGAFRYFKDTVHRFDLANEWYSYRDECYRKVARDWCEAHGVEVEHSAHPA